MGVRRLKHAQYANATNGKQVLGSSPSNAGASYNAVGETKVELKKRINLFHCVSIIVGIIIGAGIFVAPVGITAQVHSVGMSLVLWGITGLFSMLCALCYAELGSCIPESGGEYVYIKRSWGDFPAFMCLWMNCIIINPVCVAAASLVFATYLLRPWFPDCDAPPHVERLAAALIIALLVAINSISVAWVTKLQAAISACKVSALIVIIIIGFVSMGQGNTTNFENSFADSDYSVGAISVAFYSGFFAFGGWSYLNFLTEEVIDPHRNLPLGIMISISIVTIIYITANVAYFAVLTPAELLESSAVAVTFLERTVPSLSYVVPYLISISVVGGMNGSILSMSRLFYVAARNNHLPRIISMISVKNMTPVPSLISMLLLVLVMQTFDNIFFLIEMMGFSLSIVLVFVFSGQVLLRWKEPDLPRPIKLPILLPATLSLVSVAILAFTVYQKPNESGIALVIIACGIPAYVMGTLWTKPAFIQAAIDDSTIFLQKVLQVSVQDSDDENISPKDFIDGDAEDIFSRDFLGGDFEDILDDDSGIQHGGTIH